MAIFGTTNSKLKSGVTEVDLDFGIIEPSWNIPQLIRNVSVVNRITTFIKIVDDFAEFTVVLNIWKNSVPKDVMADILQYNHLTVKFCPHADSGVYVQASGGGDADFYVTEMKPFYLRTSPPVLRDMLLIKFQSLEAIDASASMQ